MNEASSIPSIEPGDYLIPDNNAAARSVLKEVFDEFSRQNPHLAFCTLSHNGTRIEYALAEVNEKGKLSLHSITLCELIDFCRKAGMHSEDFSERMKFLIEDSLERGLPDVMNYDLARLCQLRNHDRLTMEGAIVAFTLIAAGTAILAKMIYDTRAFVNN